MLDKQFFRAFEAVADASPVFKQFRALPLIEEMNPRECSLLFSCFKIKHFEMGQMIYEAGKPSGSQMHLILNGHASVVNSNNHVYATLQEGDVFGLFSFLDESRLHSATVKADSGLIVLVLDREYFNLVTIEDQPLGQLLLRFMFRLLSRMALKLEVEYAAIHEFALSSRS